MRRKIPAIAILAFGLTTTAALARKKKMEPAHAGAAAQMTGDQRILHALDRLTFGPRAQDFREVKAIGLDRWIDQQLHPEDLAENYVLEAKLAPLDTLRMTSYELVQHYPTPQIVRAMVDGRIGLPEDPMERMMIRKLVARFSRKQGTGADLDPKLTLASLPLDPQTRDTLASGQPKDRLAVIQSMPAGEQLEVLDALPPADLRKLYNPAPPELRRRIQMFSGPMQVVNQDLVEGKILRAVYSNRPLEEVLTDFWFNHFNVYLDKGADRYLVTTYERDVIRPHVLGTFHDLLLATAQSPAMLFYLDNWQSAGPAPNPNPNRKRERGLNENYGRELMELQTLGVDGGYTQKDVTEVARCFTGWTIREPNRGGGFDFNPRMHDNGEKHVLGVTIPAGGGMEDGLKVIDILSHHPSTAHFISRQLAVRFVSDDPPAALVDRMANTFLSTGGDLREVMRTMLNSPEFEDPANFRAKVKSPLEMVASAIRAVDGDIDYAFGLQNLLNQLGEPLYRKQEPTGYSNRGADWLNSASLAARMNFAISLASGKVPGVKVDASRFTGDTVSIARAVLFTDPSPAAEQAIDMALSNLPASNVKNQGAYVAGLALGSPDFQRR